jgi:hypothetical protein
VQGGQHAGLAVDDEAEVTDVGLVEDRMYDVGVVADAVTGA